MIPLSSKIFRKGDSESKINFSPRAKTSKRNMASLVDNNTRLKTPEIEQKI